LEDSTSGDRGGAIELAARVIAPDLRRLLRSRYRLVPDHDDLIQDTLLDLQVYLRTRELDGPPDSLRALAFTILKRRVMDRFREEAKSYAAGVIDASPEPTTQSAETVASYRQLLVAVLGLIARMDPADRDLLLDEAAGSDRQSAMSAATRQRLSRLRGQLREFLRQKGVSPGDLKEGNDG
jgi:DNA-directed RNA polymerase specialized sigma24 family protein